MGRLLVRYGRFGAGWLLIGALTTATAGEIEYNRDVRPILSENCFRCHGPDSGARKADLRLDLRDAAIKAAAITPGDVEASELVYRVLSDEPDGDHAASGREQRF